MENDPFDKLRVILSESKDDKSKFKKEFKKRLYNFVLRLIEFLDRLPKDNVSRRICLKYSNP